MTSTVYSRLPPPSPPSADDAEEGKYAAAEELMAAPLTRANVTLLQALSQPSRLRRRVAPTFEILSWDGPEQMTYNLNSYRAPGTQLSSRTINRNVDRDGYNGQRYHDDDDGHVGSAWRGDRGSGVAAAEEDVAPPSLYSRADERAGGARSAERDEEEVRASRQHPERPPPPLPWSRQYEPSSTSSGTRLRPRPSDDRDDDDEAWQEGGDPDEEDVSEVDYEPNHYDNHHDNVLPSGGEPNKTGRLNMRAFEERFNAADEAPALQAGETGKNGTTRREDLPMRVIYASHDSDDASYRKRPVDVPPPPPPPPPRRQWGGQPQEREEDCNVDRSRPARFREEAGSAEASGSSGRGRGALREEGRGSFDEDRDDDGSAREFDEDTGKGRRPLRDTWERPRSDHHDTSCRNDARPHRGSYNEAHNDDHNTSPSSSSVPQGDARAADREKEEHRSDDPYYRPYDDDYTDDEDEALCGEVISCDSYDAERKPPQRPPRRPQPASHPTRRSAPRTVPPPPAAPVHGHSSPKGPQLHARRGEKTAPQNKRKRTARHNPKAFKNTTTYSWISTNTTTTVILPAATVQLVPLAGVYHPVVEEVPTEERWASSPYQQGVPQVGPPAR
ncbi:hypothetical protein ABB37_06711 [Leptomonas pyrrhocoris]|uniref:Uncharacterized protein n=1 Tax=Leptomonas pyrrhocoris TaxID=157538 RepID=A0A0M9FX78_LEPPY|nr:hypothetical protein ABB37_06711 [Leptomonas pyrrhocoris]KPA77935.1 hypothetical protein ABB37_06711 [Leptomonas pyrrhocoris]|eukprot:XP_015656374.1 hypothetical protein ABB37_06711 [Leptomonas pyrrhocoris]